MAIIIAVANQKGGVAKTTSTINIGHALNELGKKVLLIDLDPQASLTIGMGIEPDDLQKTLYNVLCEKINIKEIIIDINGIALAPSTIDLSVAELNLSGEMSRENVLKRSLKKIEKDFDYILIDCPPSLGLLTINALSSCKHVIIPTTTEYLAFRGVRCLVETIQKVQDYINSDIELFGILPTMHDNRTIHSREVLEQFENDYKETYILDYIKRSIKVSDSMLASKAVLNTAPKHEISEAYRNVARKIIENI